jgi:hypothetical protein
MKLMTFSKRFLALLLICSMLVLACACTSGKTDETESEQAGDATNSTEKETTAATEKPLLTTDILVSGEKSFRIIYAEGYKSQALKVQDKLMGLDKSYTVGSGKYEMALDTDKAADGTPEILIGETNRPESAEAKKLITKEGNFYAIYATATAIAVYSAEAEGIEAGVKTLNSNLVRRNASSVVYANAKGNYTMEYEALISGGATLLEALTNTAKSKNLPVFSISVSTADGINSSSVVPGNPCQNCYSVTKVYCVTAIGMLYDEGKIKTTDTIGDIFAEEIAAYGIEESKWADITIHDVMKHNAGFKQGGLPDIDAQDATKWASQDYLKLTLEAELTGTKSNKYTDAAYYLISRVVSKISGENLDVFLAKRLFNKTDCREYAFAECPQGYPMGATGLYIRSSDVAKLGRIYLDGGKYGDEQIISKEWVDLVIEKGYELNRSSTGYAKGGMRGQYLFIDFNKNVSVAWHSYDPNDTTWPLGDTLKAYLQK